MDLLRRCLTKMEELEKCVRSSYSESVSSKKSPEFRLMLLLDGCFLLHLLQRHVDSGEKPNVDLVAAQAVGRLWIWNLVRYDLLSLQNQIPFIVILSLYDLLKTQDINLVDCAINLFSTLDLCRKQKQPKFCIPVDQVHHLLHLIYLSVLPCPPYCCKSSPKPQSTPYWIPSATELKKVGLKFKERKKERGFLSFLDVKFSDGVMEIPQLKVDDYSISLFRNFIAFEQCYAETEYHVTIYAAFMDFLIKTEKDVRLLHKKDILINSITVAKDRDATHFISRLCNEVHYALDKDYLRKLVSDVTEYHDSKWHKPLGYLIEKLTEAPWGYVSANVAILSLLFTLFRNH
ncbi:putative UPF0481 protein [Cocos nucifera]|uniref:Putative UPF0481 protein n=1 Tax=Cocos nucifera TaxID=13894 RepID=A0A8K0MY44_COCNU|nr:putative UPF0481 protein [Cocos nucifera]